MYTLIFSFGPEIHNPHPQKSSKQYHAAESLCIQRLGHAVTSLSTYNLDLHKAFTAQSISSCNNMSFSTVIQFPCHQSFRSSRHIPHNIRILRSLPSKSPFPFPMSTVFLRISFLTTVEPPTPSPQRLL